MDSSTFPANAKAELRIFSKFECKLQGGRGQHGLPTTIYLTDVFSAHLALSDDDSLEHSFEAISLF